MTEERTTSICSKIKSIQDKISVKKDGVNPFYESKYVTLDNLMEKLQPLLDEQGLMVLNINIPGGVRTSIIDVSNEDVVTSEFIVGELKDPQALGKVLTYGRRYNLTSIFNVLADEDDDAESFYERGSNKGAVQKEVSKTTKQDDEKPRFNKEQLDAFVKVANKYPNADEAIKAIKTKYKIGKEKQEEVRKLYQSLSDIKG